MDAAARLTSLVCQVERAKLTSQWGLALQQVGQSIEPEHLRDFRGTTEPLMIISMQQLSVSE